MTSSSFDAVKAVERLESAGVPAEQARMHALLLCEILRDASRNADIRQELTAETSELKMSIAKLDAKIDRVDAKVDRVDAKVDRVDARISELEQRIDIKIQAAIAGLKSELILWVVSVGILQSALITGLVLKVVH